MASVTWLLMNGLGWNGNHHCKWYSLSLIVFIRLINSLWMQEWVDWICNPQGCKGYTENLDSAWFNFVFPLYITLRWIMCTFVIEFVGAIERHPPKARHQAQCYLQLVCSNLIHILVFMPLHCVLLWFVNSNDYTANWTQICKLKLRETKMFV